MLSWETGLQDTRQKELKGSEIVFLGIHPVLPNDTRCFSSTELFPTLRNCHVPHYAANNLLIESNLPSILHQFRGTNLGLPGLRQSLPYLVAAVQHELRA